MPVLFLTMSFHQPKVALDEKTGTATCRIVDLHSRCRIEDTGHEDCDFSRGIKFTSTLALALSKLSQEVLVGSAKNIRLHVVKSQPVATQNLDQSRQTRLVHDGLSGSCGVEV